MRQALRYISFLFLLFGGYINLPAQVVGKFYSMVYNGGLNTGSGTINVFDPLTNKDTDLVDLTGPNGKEPYGAFIQLNDGMLYGTTAYGGPNASSNLSGLGNSDGAGDIIRYNIQTGQETILYNLVAGTDGSGVYGSLCHATNDTLYGVTYTFGPSNQGTFFCFNYHTMQFKTLFALKGGIDGSNPAGGLMQASNGILYVLTSRNQYNGGDGTIFSYNLITKDSLRLHSFGIGTDANDPREGTLLQASNGLLYGLSLYGGAYDTGALFSYNINTGRDSVLVNFTGTNGKEPSASLIQASDGKLYGTTSLGGAYGQGTLFSYDTGSNTETVLYSFDGSAANGGQPFSDVMQASDGLLYGNASLGGAYGAGVIYSYNINTSTETTLYNYNDTTGRQPLGDLFEAMSTSVSIVNNICSNDSVGSITISVRGGKPPFTYTWSNGATTSSITNLKPGIYTDTVRDSKGITFSNIDTIKPLPMLLSFHVANPCYNGTSDSAIVFINGGFSPFTYHWSDGQTTDTLLNVPAGSYTCNVTDAHGCPGINTVVLTQAAPVTITSIVANEQTYPYNNGSATAHFSGGIPLGDTVGYYYLWTNGASGTTNADSLNITGLDSGYYHLCVTSIYGCGSTCDSALVLTGMENINNPGGLIKIYPVPSSGLITLSLKGNGFENINITDALGRQVYTQTLNDKITDTSLTIDLGKQPNGIYILYVTSQQGFSTGKIIIQK